MQVNLRICPPQARDIRLKTGFIEPTKHRVKFLAQHEPDERQWKLLEPHRLAQDPAEYLCRFQIGEFASGNFQRLPNEVFGTFEGQR
jgi:hypothetical protein